MKVICVNYGYRIRPEDPEYVKEGKIYTVRCEETLYSQIAQREVETYGFEEIGGLYEKSMFIPLSNQDERLLHLLKTKPLRKVANNK